MPNSKRTEHEEQVAFIQWFRKTWPGVLIYAVPNGGFRGRVQGARLVAEGVVAGIPDLHVPAWNLWVEMKRQKGGVLSAKQKEQIQYLEHIGHHVIVGRGAKDAARKVAAAWNRR